MKTTPKIEPDPVMLEVWRIKEDLARKDGFDVRRMGEAARAKQWLSGHKVVSFAKARVRTAS